MSTARRTHYPALMLFGIVYITTLAIIVSPQTFRPDPAPLSTLPAHPDPTTKGRP